MIFGYNGTHGAGYWYVPVSFIVLIAFWLAAVAAVIVLWRVRENRR